METFDFLALIGHILSGYLALAAGTIVIFARKGTLWHRRLGRVFFYSMLGVTGTAVCLSFTKEISFLLYVGIFVFYQNYGGFTSVRNRALTPGWTSLLILVVALLNALFMLFTFNVVLVVFGIFSLLLISTDLKIYYTLYRKKEVKPLIWLARHISMMMGAYIGTLTAFLVVNVNFVKPYWVIWIFPSFLLVPLMRYWIWKYTQKPLKGDASY